MTRRDLVVASLASLVTLAAVAGARVAAAPDVMRSTVFDWKDMKVSATKTGEAAHAPHQHPDEELMIVLQGTLEAFNDGATKRIGAGSAIFQASNEMHG